MCIRDSRSGVYVVPASHPWDLELSSNLINPTMREQIIPQVIDHFGRLDILVNNAGALGLNLHDSLELMVVAPHDLSQRAAGCMLDGGHIVNVLSISAFQGARNISEYIAAKHALLGLTRAMAIELAPKIHVNAIAPGHIETDMLAQMTPERRAFLESITPAGRFGRPEEVADALMYLINSTYIYGQTIVVDGGWLVKNG